MIYVDNAATTKMSRTAIDAMLPYMEEVWGNPSSLYEAGQKAADSVTVRLKADLLVTIHG